MWAVKSCGEAGLYSVFFRWVSAATWRYLLSTQPHSQPCPLPLGTNYESSFENEILSRTRHCQIWAYDSTVNSHGPRVDRIHHHRTHFERFGLASVDAHGPRDSPKAYTLESLMAANGEFFLDKSTQRVCSGGSIILTGHKHIDILKIDVEGWEFDIMASIVRPFVTSGEPLPFGQLNLEMHVWNKKFAEFLSWWEMLETAGLRPFMTEVRCCRYICGGLLN